MKEIYFECWHVCLAKYFDVIGKKLRELMIWLSWLDFLRLNSVSWLFLDQQMNLNSFEKNGQMFSEVFFINVLTSSIFCIKVLDNYWLLIWYNFNVAYFLQNKRYFISFVQLIVHIGKFLGNKFMRN